MTGLFAVEDEAAAVGRGGNGAAGFDLWVCDD